ncbi:ribonuclease J [Minwuia sp.]|uniref:ribonuclease J n=1 Tax=Minwuia sp. TaxID=2493630 RepID=UPI003A929391
MSKTHPHRDGLVIVPLGGCGEIGMNLTLYGVAGKWLMVDCGMTFADESLPGVDLIVPDPTFIESEAKDLVGLVITHAHEDHIGAVHHLWERFRCPVYVTPFAEQSLNAKLDEAGLRGDVPVHVFENDDAIDLDPFRITPIGLTHSTLEMKALAIETRHGTVMHTGDWKLDKDPLMGPTSDEAALKAWGDKGVLALVCDSTNVFDPGTSGSESDVRRALIDLVKERPDNRIVVTTFASNVARLESVARAAEASGRAFVLVGRSLWKFYQAARAVGYLDTIKPPLTDKDAARMPRNKTLLLCTGCQGEPRGAMARVAMDDHPNIDLRPGDTVIFSSKIIPGNEKTLYRMHNAMALNDIEVISEKDHFVHVSGHPAREELKRMYELVRPELVVPVHGEARHLIEQARFAVEEGGMPAAQVILNGDVLRLAPGEPEIVSEVPVGRLAVDPAGLVVMAAAMLQHRRKLAGNGVMMIVLVVDADSELVEDPRIMLAGVAEGREMAALTNDVAVAIERELGKVNGRRPAGDDALAEAASRAARRVVKQVTSRRPLTEVEVVRLEEGEKTANESWKEAV